MNIFDRLDRFEEEIKKPSFRHNKGLSNEVGYYIFDYPANEEAVVRKRVEYIAQKSITSSDEYTIKVFDLYDIMIEILQDKGRLEKCFDIEQKNGFEKLSRGISNLLKVNSTDGLIVKYIEERTSDKNIVFITGIGKCYPIIRSHTILNNLHMVIDNISVVMFYPGRYTGQELILFKDIKDDNYYRAFRIVE
ncbi:MAG: DUF1788 domain-containing protein [Ruminococcus flavefaciens]|nr:DUF1788 domain-containing protein [Ruminococcus flavefaciens]